jgi:hypothetical protein
MKDYQNGKIYKLVGSGLTYYGSTIQKLSQRKARHKCHLNCSSKLLFEKGDVDIVLVENFPCNSKEELQSRERWYIENNNCINKAIPMRTKKEYYNNNKDRIKKYYKEYYKTNKDIVKENYEANKEKKKEYYKTNKEKIKKYYKNNKDKYNERTRLYRLHKKIDKLFFE